MSDEIIEQAKVASKVEKTKNNGEYSPKKIKSVSQKSKLIRTALGEDKEKIYKQVTYENGVVKNLLVGIRKGKRIVLDRGIDIKQLDK